MEERDSGEDVVCPVEGYPGENAGGRGTVEVPGSRPFKVFLLLA